MRRFLSLISAFTGFASVAFAQVNLEEEFFSLPDSVTNEYLDTVRIERKKPNNYFMAGVYGGATVTYGDFNPTRLVNLQPIYPMGGFSVVRHFSMFGLFPNMGIEFGAQLNYEGYEFKENKETGTRTTESGAYAAVMRVPEAFFLSHFHLDAGDHFKLMAKVGLYGGYRLDIKRTLAPAYEESSWQEYENEFRDYDKRLSYGLQGGLGAGLVFDPIEIHLMVQVKWGWNSFWEPDYASQWYYRFGYPLDGAVTLGVYYQITPRKGYTKAGLRRLAKKMVREQNDKQQ